MTEAFRRVLLGGAAICKAAYPQSLHLALLVVVICRHTSRLQLRMSQLPQRKAIETEKQRVPAAFVCLIFSQPSRARERRSQLTRSSKRMTVPNLMRLLSKLRTSLAPEYRSQSMCRKLMELLPTCCLCCSSNSGRVSRNVP